MELVIVLFLALVVIGAAVFGALIYLDTRKARKEPQYILYLLKVEPDGRFQIKRSSKPELWEWRF